MLPRILVLFPYDYYLFLSSRSILVISSVVERSLHAPCLVEMTSFILPLK